MIVHFRWRDDQAGPGLAYLASAGEVESRQPDLATFHHVRVSSSAFPNSGQTNASSPSSASRRASSAQVARGLVGTGVHTRRPPPPDISTSSPALAPISRSSGLGMITPDELPILRTALRIGTVL